MATTFRLTEHHTAGGMSALTLPWLAELQPEMFAEIDPVLAAERGIEDGGWMTISTAARARSRRAPCVTERMRPLRIDGRDRPPGRACRGTGATAGPSTGDAANDLIALSRRPEHVDPRVQGVHRATCAPARRDARHDQQLAGVARRRRPDVARRTATTRRSDPTSSAMSRDSRSTAPGAQRMGFFTDTTVCIGCKACEVACKQWNDLPADGGEFRKGGSYDHTGAARRDDLAPRALRRALEPTAVDAPRADRRTAVEAAAAELDSWVFMSDVCKHCTNAGCMDACPTGALIRTEFETVVAPARRLQRLRLLHPVVPVRRRSTATTTTAAPPSARSATTGSRTGWSRRARRRARPTRSSSAPYDELVERRRSGASRALHERGVDGAYLYGAGDAPGESWPAASARSSCSPSRRSATACRPQADSPIQENVVPATLAAVGRRAAARAAPASRRGVRR